MMTSDVEVTYRKRFDRHFEELRWLYMELYSNSSMFAELCDTMERFSRARSASLKERDLRKEADPDWYKDSDQIGMSLYVQNFGGNLQGVRNRLDYIEKCNVLRFKACEEWPWRFLILITYKRRNVEWIKKNK